MADRGAGATPNQFCPNCGAPVAATDTFCPNCGFDLRQSKAETPTPSQTSAKSTATPKQAAPLSQTPTRANRPLSRKKKRLIAIIGAAAVLLIGTYIGLKQYYSPTRQIDRLAADIRTGSAATVAKEITTTDSALKITAGKVKPFLAYLRADKQRLNQFTNGLRTSGRTDYGMVLAERGKHLLLFPKYVISYDNPAYVSLYVGRTGVTVTLDGAKILTSTASKRKAKAGPMLPGVHTFVAIGTIKGKKVKYTDKQTISHSGSQGIANFDFATIKLIVNSNLEGGTVVDNYGDKLGTIKNGKTIIGPIALQKSMRFWVEKQFDGGKVTTTEFKVDDFFGDGRSVDTEIRLNNENTLTTNDFDVTLRDMFYDVQYLSSKDTDSEAKLGQYFTDTNSDAYKFWQGIGDSYAKRTDVSSISFGSNVRSVEMTDKDTYKVDYDVTYHVSYTDYEKNERIQTFNSTMTVVKSGKDEYGDATYKISALDPKLTKVYDNNANEGKDSTGDSTRSY